MRRTPVYPLKVQIFFTSPSRKLTFPFFSTRSSPPPILPCISSEPKPSTLTEEELTKINLLIPRLCLSNDLHTAINLIRSALLANPPLNHLPLSVLAHTLASQPSLTLSMFLLTRLHHTPQAHCNLSPITTILISKYLLLGKPKEAIKVLNWVSRPGSNCNPDGRFYGVLVSGLCRNGESFEVMGVLRRMVKEGFFPGREVRERVFRCLIREARVREAKEIEEAFDFAVGERDVKKVLEVINRMIHNWTD